RHTRCYRDWSSDVCSSDLVEHRSQGALETQIGSERARSHASTPVVSYLQSTLRSMLDAGNLSCAMEVTSYDADLQRLDGIRFARSEERRVGNGGTSAGLHR